MDQTQLTPVYIEPSSKEWCLHYEMVSKRKKERKKNMRQRPNVAREA